MSKANADESDEEAYSDSNNFKGHAEKIKSKSQVTKIQNRYEAYNDD